MATLLVAAVFRHSLIAQTSPLSREDQRLLKWFDGLGYTPNLASTPLMRITVLQGGKATGFNDSNDVQLGFLLSEQDDRPNLLLFSLTTRMFERPDIRMDRVELRDLAREMVIWKAADSGPSLSSTDIFVLARASADAGLEQLAHDLIVSARAESRDPDNFQHELSDDIAWRDLFFTLTDYRLGATRAVVRDRLKRLADNFPSFESAELARNTARTLSRMIAEERNHAPGNAPTTPLQGQARIRELIFSLRDETGFQMSQPGSVEFLRFSPSTSAANQLVAAGYDAVPQLIDALDDTRLTRGVYFRGSPRYVVTIGECITEILREIIGESFKIQNSHGFDPKASKARAKTWWANRNARE